MRPRLSLRARIAIFFIALLVGVQLVAFAFVNQTSYDTAQAKIEDELDVGQRVLERVLDQNAATLVQTASILAADFAFREAVATRDLGTVRSALENHGARIHASAMLFLDAGGRIVAATGDAASAEDTTGTVPAELATLLPAARMQGFASAIRVFQGRPFQLVVVPVRAPVTIGWIELWFAIDEPLAQDLRQLTNLDVSFILLGPSHCRVVASTLAPPARGHLEAALGAAPRVHGTLRIEVPEGAQQLRVLPLSSAAGGSLAAVIERPLATGLRYFRALQTTLVIIGLVSLVLSAVGSLLIARGITAPIRRLLESTRRLQQGDYAAPIDASGGDEVGALAAGLDHMRLGLEERERRILKLAYEDGLTGLPNRLRFGSTLQRAIADANAAGHGLAILVMDLDRFRYVNDALGHGIGDHVLQQVAQRLRGALGEAVLVARLGGDEFGVLLPASTREQAAGSADRVSAALEPAIDFEGQPIDVGASIGIAVYPEHGRSADALIRNADIAMYVAKRGHIARALFDPNHDDTQKQQLSLIGELRRAVERDELDLYYQPKLAIASATVVGAEALVRWHHPQRGFVPPGQFIPFAESTGYIRAISRWVLERAVRQAGEWRRAGHALRISVNLSTKDLLNRELPAILAAALERHDVPASAFCLEITESGVMEDPDHVLEVLDRLAALGVGLSIDDYGTGYSSLTYLMRLPVDELKIDRSFVGNLARDAHLRTIVRSTIELGHNLGLQVVAEGVEDQEALDVLAELRCDGAQGYLISPPLPAADFESWVSDRPMRRVSARPTPLPPQAAREASSSAG